MPEFLTRIILKVLLGYVRIFKVIGVLILWIILLCFFSVLIVFPQWYFAIHYKAGYNIFIFVLLFLIVFLIVGAKIIRFITSEYIKRFKTEFGLFDLLRFEILVLLKVKILVLLRFIVLSSELALIQYLLLSDQVLFTVPGMLLVFEFLFFLCLTKGDKETLTSSMKTVLIILTSFDFLYTGFVLFARGNHLYGVFIGVMYLVAIGYLCYKPGTLKKMKICKRPQCENEKAM